MNKSPKSFPHPYEVKTPEGAEGWEEMYPYYLRFHEDRKEVEDKFWFCDTMHWTEPLYPFDSITAENAIHALSQYNSRIFRIPTALGIDLRVLNGYAYISPVEINDPETINARLEDFRKRAGYYFQNWDELYIKWKEKVTNEIEGLKKLEVPDLPDIEEEEIVTKGAGISTGYHLLESYNRVVESMSKIWQYHFEFLNLGYAAYLDLSIFMKKVFPDITDQKITKIVAGIDVILYRPDNGQWPDNGD